LNKSKLITSIDIFSFTIILTTALFTPTPQVNAVNPVTLTIVGPDGTIVTMGDITQYPPTIGWGGYKSNTQLISGIFEGVSIASLCEQAGFPLQSYQNVTVQTSGGSGTNTTFNFSQVVLGQNVSTQFTLYDNNTGIAAIPTQPVTLMVAYEFANGTLIPGTGGYARLMIVGPESLLFPGPGFAGVISLNITNVAAIPTATTTPTAPPPTEEPTVEPTTMPTTTSPTETITATPTSEPEQKTIPTTYIAVAVIAIAVVLIALVVLMRGKKPELI
jgi:hypothetical protein